MRVSNPASAELRAEVCRHLAAAAFLWRRYPRFARQLLEGATEGLRWLATEGDEVNLLQN